MQRFKRFRFNMNEMDAIPFDLFAEYLANIFLCALIISTCLLQYILLCLGMQFGLLIEINVCNMAACAMAYTLVWVYRRQLTLLTCHLPGRIGLLVCTLYWSHELAEALQAGETVSEACDRLSVNPAMNRSKPLLQNMVSSARQGCIDIHAGKFAQVPEPLISSLSDGLMTGFLADYLYSCSKDLLGECKVAVSKTIGGVAAGIFIAIQLFGIFLLS